MRYGVCYKGSKNGIAEWVYSHFPKATNFYDLFAGGCAITQIALMKSQYQNYFCNDIDGDGISLFLDAIHGKFQNETRWISREDFFKLKDKEPYVRYCWSFGNNGRDYLYSKEIEPYKKAVHFAVVFLDLSLISKCFPEADFNFLKTYKDIYSRKIYLQRYLKKYSIAKDTIFQSQVDKMDILQNLDRLERLNNLYNLMNADIGRSINIERQQQLEALNRLQSLQSLHISFLSYEKVKIEKDSIVFCDIPYSDTNAYGAKNKNTFDHNSFYSWCKKQTELVLISEYKMPEDFICIDSIEKPVMLNSGASLKATEKLFIPAHQKELYERIKNKVYRQLEFNF